MQMNLLEVTREKGLVSAHQTAEQHGIHHFQILDGNERPIENARC